MQESQSSMCKGIEVKKRYSPCGILIWRRYRALVGEGWEEMRARKMSWRLVES